MVLSVRVNVNIVLSGGLSVSFSLHHVLLSGLVRVRLTQVVGVGGVVVSISSTATTVVDLTPDIIFILLEFLYLGPQFRNFWI